MNKPVFTAPKKEYTHSPSERNQGQLPPDYPLEYDRVTKILRATATKEEQQKLNDWRNRTNKLAEKNPDKYNTAEEILELSRVTGVTTHGIIEDYLHFGSQPNFLHLPPQIQPLWLNVSSYVDIIRQYEFKTEVPVYSHQLRYRGTMDLIVKWLNKTWTVLDWKTKDRPVRKEWIRDKAIQCAAYAIAYEENTGIEAKEIVVGVISPQKFQPFHFDIDDCKDEWLRRLNEFKTKKSKLNLITDNYRQLFG